MPADTGFPRQDVENDFLRVRRRQVLARLAQRLLREPDDVLRDAVMRTLREHGVEFRRGMSGGGDGGSDGRQRRVAAGQRRAPARDRCPGRRRSHQPSFFSSSGMIWKRSPTRP